MEKVVVGLTLCDPSAAGCNLVVSDDAGVQAVVPIPASLIEERDGHCWLSDFVTDFVIEQIAATESPVDRQQLHDLLVDGEVEHEEAVCTAAHAAQQTEE